MIRCDSCGTRAGSLARPGDPCNTCGRRLPRPSSLSQSDLSSILAAGVTSSTWQPNPWHPNSPQRTPARPAHQVAPTYSGPPPGSWALELWDGLRNRYQISVKGLSWGFGLGDGDPSCTVIGSAVGGSAGAQPDQPLRASIDFEVPGGFGALARMISGVNRAKVTEDRLRKMQASVAPVPPDQLGAMMNGMIEGPWQIVAGADVRVARYGHCPPTHLPAYACQSRDEADRLIEQTCALGYDGVSRIAPELAFGLTLDGLRAFGQRLDALARGAIDEMKMPPPQDLIAKARHTMISEGITVPPPPSLEPPTPEPQSIEEQILQCAGGFRVLRPDDFVMWAAERGLVNPANLDAGLFPGAVRVLSYPAGWFSIVYPDHVRLGKLTGPGVAPVAASSLWVSVSDRYPPDRAWVLVKGEAGMADGRPFCTMARQDRGHMGTEWLDEQNEPLSHRGLTPTHWRPIEEIL